MGGQWGDTAEGRARIERRAARLRAGTTCTLKPHAAAARPEDIMADQFATLALEAKAPPKPQATVRSGKPSAFRAWRPAKSGAAGGAKKGGPA